MAEVPQLFDELTAIVQALDAGGVDYILVGGLAINVLVGFRSTEDIDLLIREEDWPVVPGLLLPLGYHDLSGPMDFSRLKLRRLTKIAGETALVADFLLAGPGLQDALEKSLALRWNEQLYRVATPETMIRLKEMRRSRIDLIDLEGLREIIRLGGGSGS